MLSCSVSHRGNLQAAVLTEMSPQVLYCAGKRFLIDIDHCGSSSGP